VLGVVGAVVAAGPNPENEVAGAAAAPGAGAAPKPVVDPKETGPVAGAPGAGAAPKAGVVVEVAVLPKRLELGAADVEAAGVGAPKLKEDVVLLPNPPPKADGAGAPNAGAGADDDVGPGAVAGANKV